MTRAVRVGIVVAVALCISAGVALWYSASTIESPPTAPVKTDLQPALVEQSIAKNSEPRPPRADQQIDDPAFAKWANAIKAELIRRDDAESLIVAVLLALSDYAPEHGSDAEKFRQQVELLKKASARAPSNAAVQWLTWLACKSIVERKYPCDADGFARALRSADPKNAMPLIGALERARESKDAQAEAEALAAIETSGGFSDYYAVVQPMLYNTIASVRIAPPPARAEDNGFPPLESLSIGLSTSLRPATFKPLIDSCSRLSTDPLAARCLAISKEMRSADNYFARRVGLMIAERVTPFGSKSFGDINEERRTLSWQQNQISKPWIPPDAMRRLLLTTGGEVEMWQAWLRENGIATTPPVEWEGK